MNRICELINAAKHLENIASLPGCLINRPPHIVKGNLCIHLIIHCREYILRKVSGKSHEELIVVILYLRGHLMHGGRHEHLGKTRLADLVNLIPTEAAVLVKIKCF